MGQIIAQGELEVISRPLQIVTTDGVTLAGTWFLPGPGVSEPIAAVVIACGGGIPARRYRRFAYFLAAKGFAALTFDYRGIGQSRKGSLHGLNAGAEHWGVLDFGAALATAKAAYPDLPLEAVAHSIGSLLVGGAPDAPRLARLVFFAPHTGYYGDYRPRWRWLLFLTWHVMMPIVTKIVGYFPGRALRLGEDLPYRFALDWAGRRRPDLLATPADQHRFGAILERFPEVRAKALAISVSDDAFAPPEAGRRLLLSYPNVSATYAIIHPAMLGRRRLGHFAFLRRNIGKFFWERSLAWLLPSELGGRASSYRASAAGVPPSGTKGDALAGSTIP